MRIALRPHLRTVADLVSSEILLRSTACRPWEQMSIVRMVQMNAVVKESAARKRRWVNKICQNEGEWILESVGNDGDGVMRRHRSAEG